LLWYAASLVCICNHSRARLVDSSRNRTFSRGYPDLMHSYGGLVEHRGRTLHRWSLMPNISCVGCPGLSWIISAQFTVEMCIAVWKREKITKNPHFLRFKVIQSHRCWYARKARQQCLLWYAASLCLSATVLTLDEPIVVRLRILRGSPSLMPSFEGNLLTQRHQSTSLETRDPGLPCGENPESLSHLCLIRYRVVTPHTDRRTDRIAVANTRPQQYRSIGTAVARKTVWRSKQGCPTATLRYQVYDLHCPKLGYWLHPKYQHCELWPNRFS